MFIRRRKPRVFCLNSKSFKSFGLQERIFFRSYSRMLGERMSCSPRILLLVGFHAIFFRGCLFRVPLFFDRSFFASATRTHGHYGFCRENVLRDVMTFYLCICILIPPRKIVITTGVYLVTCCGDWS